MSDPDQEPTMLVGERAAQRRFARWWPVVPGLLVVALFVLRAALHTPALAALATVPHDPKDPPATVAYAGSLAITRGGPVIVGFQSETDSRLQIGTRDLRGKGLVKERMLLPTGPTKLRFAAAPGARLVWSPVGRRGDPEYVAASSLSPEPPERATFDAPGTNRTDGVIALTLLAIVVGTCAMLVRHRLAKLPRRTWFAIAGVALVALVARLVGIGDQGQTWDEDVNWAAGKNYISNVLALDFDKRSWTWNFEHPPVMKYLAGIGAQLQDGFTAARALSALWIAAGCALLVPIGARLFSLRVGLLAGLVAALLPTLVAHGQIVGHEAPTVLWWTLGIWLALGVHDELASRRQLYLRLAALGAVVGIAVASRFVNGLLGPLVSLIVVVQAPKAWRNQTLIWGAAILPLATVLAFYAVWPRLWFEPVAALKQSLGKLDTLHAVEPFLGSTTNKPGAHYFVVYLVATLPVGILAGVVAWIGRAIAWRSNSRSTLIVAGWFAIPLVITLSPVKQDGVRYVMPCILALAMMAAAGFDWLATLVETRRAQRQQSHRALFPLLAGAIAIYLAITLARIRPYYLDYFGEHVGGTAQVAQRRWFETAWWGEGLGEALAYVNSHALSGDRIFNGCVLPNHLTWYREDLWARATPNVNEANWIVHYAPATRGCPIPKTARRVFDVTAGGTPLAIVYEAR